MSPLSDDDMADPDPDTDAIQTRRRPRPLLVRILPN
jgi:hypothetical protein